MAKDGGKLGMGAVTVEMPGVTITRPGMGYYFDDAKPTCPLCDGIELEYRCRAKGKPATAAFKCTSCNAKFEKTRTTECAYFRDLRDVRVEIAPILKCGNCSTDLDTSVHDFEMAERVFCPGCHKLVKGRTEEAEAEADVK